MNPLVSIIVPVYNVEEYLRECIQSIINQTYNNIETILIDDGSKDESGNICDFYKEQNINKNIVVVHQVNKGLSETRNYGVSIAKGEYILFVDSDDCISPDCVEYLLRNMLNFEADISVAHMVKFTSEIPVNTKNDKSIIKMNAEDALIEMCYGSKFAMSACNKLYKKELVAKHQFPVGRIYEEVATTYKFIGDASIIVYGNSSTYFYRMRENSIVHQRLSESQLYGITASEEMLLYISEHYPNAIPAAKHKCFAKICDCVEKSFHSKEDFILLRNKAKQYSSSIMADSRATLAMKFRCLSIRMGFRISKILFSLIHTIKRYC